MRPMELALYRIPPALRWVSRLIWHIEHDFERARAEGRATEDARRRIRFVLMLFVAGFVTLGFRAAKAVLDPSLDHVVAAKPIEGERADLVDRNGAMLAVDLPYYGLSFNPADNWDLDEVRRKLPAVLPMLTPDRLEKFLHGKRRQFVIGGLTPAQKQAVDDLGIPGIYFDDEVRRAYPQGPTAGHLIGFAAPGGDGVAGAELALDPAIKAAALGHGQVALSIDLRIQAALQDELQKAAATFGVAGGSAIVTNVRTGEILGMASYPAFDPNTSGALSKDDPRRINNVTSSDYEPGSVFKVFTLATGIDTGLVNINSPIDARAPLLIGGRVVHDDEKDNSVLPLWEVFTHSSNIGAARLGMQLGPERMERYFRGFGLFNAAPSELRESARPLTPLHFNADSSAYMAFGQGIAVTPLALATGMGSVLNGGQYIPLTLRKRDPGAGPVQGRRVISEATSRTMLYLMRLNAVQGTGAKADAAAPGYRLGGKTGSAQKAEKGHMSHTLVTSFASVFPTDGDFNQDRYFVLIMLDSPHGTPETHGLNEGAWNAAPTVGKVIERIAPILGVARTPAALVQAPKPPPTAEQLNGGEQ
jgi:cell division protein FtsI (penicillin-binding protein 3)